MINKRLRRQNLLGLKAYSASELYPAIDRAITFMSQFDHSKVIRMYREGWRFYHNLNHLEDILKCIEKAMENGQVNNIYGEVEVLRFIAFYHDAIYDPVRTDNEEKSAEFFKSEIQRKNFRDTNLKRKILSEQQIEQIYNGILHTNILAKSYPFEILDLYKKFRDFDTKDFIECNWSRLVKGEKSIQKEYQFVDWHIYQEKKIDFLVELENADPRYGKACEFLSDFILSCTPKIGVYAGSFDPFHAGHLSVLRQAEKLFDKVIIAVGSHPGKPNSVESLDRRYRAIKELLPYHQVNRFVGYLTDYLSKTLTYPTTLIRGLRTDTDFKQEEAQLRIMQDLYPDLNAIFITCDKDVEHVASTNIRMMEKIKEGSSKKYTLTTQEIYNG